MKSAKKPNILLIMADQLTPFALPFYRAEFVHAPHLAALAQAGSVFDNFYCNSPICAPARYALMSGQLCSTIGAWDNSSEFPARHPTMAHHLRRLGYRTCLSGKMHFLGPDQLHGFEDRLTTDICPADFHWTQDWDQPFFHAPYHHNMENVANAGLAERSLQQDYDYDAAYQAVRWIFDHARSNDDRPFFLVASFTHPHDPYVTPRRFWDLYEDVDIPFPSVYFSADEKPEGHDQALYNHYDRGEIEITRDHVLRARRAYYGSVSFVDERVGELLSALDCAGFGDNTIVVFTADHGEMLGQRGHWYKMSHHEWSARIPLVIAGPGLPGGQRVEAIGSQVDILPTLVELAGASADTEFANPVEGTSLLPRINDLASKGRDLAISELYHDVVPAPYVMVRKGAYKYLQCEYYSPQLFDVEADPDELNDLAAAGNHDQVMDELAAEITVRYDIEKLKDQVLSSQRGHRLVYEALIKGKKTSWDFQPFIDASKQYYRDPVSYHRDEKRSLLK